MKNSAAIAFSPPEAPPKTRECIIAIDDDASTRLLLGKALASQYEVHTYASYAEAILKAEQLRPTAILVDISMPNIDGFEVLNLLRSHPATLDVPVFCMSGTESEEIRKRVENHGANGFITKPFSLPTLGADIQMLVQSLNRSLSSSNHSRRFTITHNDSERSRVIHQLIAEHANAVAHSDEILVVLGWAKGSQFFGANPPSTLETGKLIYLEIKPQLIVKFPFLIEISSVTHDLMSFLNPEVENYHLVVDEVRNLLNLNAPERALSKTIALKQSLRPLFNKQSYFTTQPSAGTHNLLLQKIARVLTNEQDE